jgi:thiosulfate reductase cytochrome b subunit
MGDPTVFHPLWERLWHWIHALLFVGLAISGLHLHWPDILPIFGDLDRAVRLHDVCAWAAIADYGVWLGFNLATGRLRQYVPTAHDLGHGALRQARFYAWGMFRGAPHPHHPTPQDKFNPLQRLSYAGLMFGLLPLLIATGLAFMVPLQARPFVGGPGGLAAIALTHTALAFVGVAFTVVHAYLITTGPTPTGNLLAMITGVKRGG